MLQIGSVCTPNEVGHKFQALWAACIVMSLQDSASLVLRGLKCRPLNCAYCGSCDSSMHRELVCLKFPVEVDHGLGFALI
uniref:Uncharacterized protein n=1 Tax=Cricetulus griseus TaxID=10029 RepID=A0A8C2LW17_CRIGR